MQSGITEPSVDPSPPSPTAAKEGTPNQDSGVFNGRDVPAASICPQTTAAPTQAQATTSVQTEADSSPDNDVHPFPGNIQRNLEEHYRRLLTLEALIAGRTGNYGAGWAEETPAHLGSRRMQNTVFREGASVVDNLVRRLEDAAEGFSDATDGSQTSGSSEMSLDLPAMPSLAQLQPLPTLDAKSTSTARSRLVTILLVIALFAFLLLTILWIVRKRRRHLDNI